jgi:hypothetical protein
VHTYIAYVYIYIYRERAFGDLHKGLRLVQLLTDYIHVSRKWLKLSQTVKNDGSR